MVKMIFTDHATERMVLRRIPRSQVRSTLEKYDEKKLEDDGDTQFIKAVRRRDTEKKLHVVAKPLPEEGKDTWLIKTVWVRGEDDPNLIIKMVRMLIMRIFRRKKRQN